MNKRYQCEFNNCRCNIYCHVKGDICKNCRHGKVWHSNKDKPPCDEYLQFYSIRNSARIPEYTSVHIYDISKNFCNSVDDLPA